MIEPGAVLCGKYRIEHLLGKGGMGMVARARHLDLDQPVALKLLLPEVLQNRDVVKRFRREAQAMVQLKGEHVCRVFDVGMLDDGAPYMVMEYLEGKDLGLTLQDQGRLTPGFAVDLVLQACEALAEAHALGIVHRDVKPPNCFVTRGPDGEPLLKVLDFGISKALGVEDGAITTSQTLIGSPSYMSPEQMHSSKDVDTRTDVWALGVVLYELVSGRRPFLGDSFAALCLAVTTKPMLPLDDVAMPDGLTEVIARCLEKRPQHRFGSMAELSAALAPYAGTKEQGERSSARTARMLGRASSPVLLTGIPVGIPPVVVRGSPSSAEPTIAAGAARRGDREAMNTLPTVTAMAVPAAGPQESPRIAGTTERTTRPLRVVRQQRRRWPWLLAAAGLALLVVALAHGVRRGEDDRRQQSTDWSGSRLQGPADAGAQPASYGDGPAIAASGSETTTLAAGVGEDQGPDMASARSPAVTDDQEPDAGTRAHAAARAPSRSERAAEGSSTETLRSARPRGERGERGDERSSASSPQASRRQRAAPAPASETSVAPPGPAATVQHLVNDAAFGSRE